MFLSPSFVSRFSDIIDGMADIASRVEVYWDEIKQCILDDMVLLGMRGIIPRGKHRVSKVLGFNYSLI